MSYNYSSNNWDLQKAHENFLEVLSNLPMNGLTYIDSKEDKQAFDYNEMLYDMNITHFVVD